MLWALTINKRHTKRTPFGKRVGNSGLGGTALCVAENEALQNTQNSKRLVKSPKLRYQVMNEVIEYALNCY